MARGAPVRESLRRINELASSRMLGGDLVVGFVDSSGLAAWEAPSIEPGLVATLAKVGVVLPSSNRGAEPGAGRLPSGPRRDLEVDRTLREVAGDRYSSAWIYDLVGSEGGVVGRVTLLRDQPGRLAAVDRELLGLVADLATIAIDRHDLQARLAHGALHDDLTGLPNRRQLLTRVRATFSAPGSANGIIHVDLDRFKVLNDSLGHEAGDAIITEVGRRFAAAVRPDDVVARVGGDEFAVLCAGIDNPAEVMVVAHRLRAALEAPVELETGEVTVSACFGVVHATGPADPTDLLRAAGLASYDAKRQGNDRIELFHVGLHDQAQLRHDVESGLRNALDRGELEVHYQPVVRLSDHTMVGVEALLRWNRPGMGVVEPAAFIPTATETGLIVGLERWVIDEALEAVAGWPDLTVAVNLSARQLADPDLVRHVAGALERHGLDPARLCLEITEVDLVSDNQAVADQLDRFDRLGVEIAIDDFGTGLATLDYLRRLATADVLKVDASFVAGVTDPSGNDLAIVAAAISLARDLGFTTVAEGVETDRQREVVADLGCELAQGYLFSRPVPRRSIDELLAARTGWTPTC